MPASTLHPPPPHPPPTAHTPPHPPTEPNHQVDYWIWLQPSFHTLSPPLPIICTVAVTRTPMGVRKTLAWVAIQTAPLGPTRKWSTVGCVPPPTHTRPPPASADHLPHAPYPPTFLVCPPIARNGVLPSLFTPNNFLFYFLCACSFPPKAISASTDGLKKRVNHKCHSDHGRFQGLRKLGSGAFAQIWWVLFPPLRAPSPLAPLPKPWSPAHDGGVGDRVCRVPRLYILVATNAREGGRRRK
jgi:hypothetical protein